MSLSKPLTVGIDKSRIKYLVGNLSLNHAQVIQLIQDVLRETLTLTIQDIEIWIGQPQSSDGHVPKRTGTLRKTLIDWLHGSNVYEGIMRLILRTDLSYASDVNAMPTGQVRHLGEKGHVYYPNMFGMRGPVILDDPRAEGNFFNKLIEFAKERIKVNLLKAKNKYLGMPGKAASTLRREIK